MTAQQTAAEPTAAPTLNLNFLTRLLEQAGPSGYEGRAAAVWLEEARGFAERVYSDHYGNAYAEIGPEDGRAVALMGHLDEIGLIVTHVDEKGHIAFLGIGGWDPQVLVGQRIRLLAAEGDLIGVIGKKAIHVMDQDDRDKASKIEDLWIDLGMEPDEVRRQVEVGTPGVIEQPPVVQNGHLISKAIDNRAGAFIVLEALRALQAAGVRRRFVAVGTAQEEIGTFGAQVSGHRLDPIAGIVVDVTHETEQPGVSPKKYGAAPFGSGANVSVGAMMSPAILRGLKDAGRAGNIPYTLSASPRYTGTDADSLALVRGGVPVGVVSIPNRYMHSPSEMVRLSDVQACIDLIAAWGSRLGEGELDFARP